MTVKYNLAVSTSRPWTLFKLLFRWRGSVWKSVTFELAIWLLLYFTIGIIYRKVLSPQQIRHDLLIACFERIAHILDEKLNLIPLDFMLGFFVTSVLNRWIKFFDNIGYIDKKYSSFEAQIELHLHKICSIALMTAAYVRGDDERSRKMRRNIVRYCVLSQALVFRDISMKVRKRFPTLDSVVAAGFMMSHEKAKLDELHYRYDKHWVPFQWALALCDDARQQQKIASDWLQQKVSEEIKRFRTNMANLYNFDWVPLPIMYAQIVVLGVHLYFFVCAISRQHIISAEAPNKSKVDAFFPFMSVLQFIFYMGWLKVAEVILNPFGEDDDDFECNFLLDKNLAVGLMIVDLGYNQPPAMQKDPFWEGLVEPLYTQQSMVLERRMSSITGSLAHVRLSDDKKIQMMPLPHNAASIRNPLNYLLKVASRSTSMNEAGNMNDKNLSRNDQCGTYSQIPDVTYARRRFSLGERDYLHLPFRSTQLARTSHGSINIISEPRYLEDVKEENEDTVHSRKTMLSQPQIPFPMSFPTEKVESTKQVSKTETG
uniref:Bestrophin homolog n=1 Tax=Elaeophora elaphi TaxID=1147741 RepID=A0A158Q7A3_9BILA